jgi:hypothetical protein
MSEETVTIETLINKLIEFKHACGDLPITTFDYHISKYVPIVKVYICEDAPGYDDAMGIHSNTEKTTRVLVLDTTN